MGLQIKTMKRLLNGQEIEMTETEIAELQASRAVVFNEDLFIQELSAAFDAKFETYWKAKGYTDISDLLSHAANTNSVYHSEALSLIQWSHANWEIAMSGLSENSNIEEIINSLEIYI